MREEGRVGLARGADGRYYVLRAGKVSVGQGAPSPDAVDRLEGFARAAMVEERQNSVLDALEKKLLSGAKVEVRHDVLYRMVVPPPS